MTLQMPSTTWSQIAAYVRQNYAIEREWPDQGFIITVDGLRARHKLFLARNHPGFGGVEHVTLEAGLGGPEHVNLLIAAKAAGKLLGGLVCADNLLSLRDSRCLSTLTTAHLNMTIGYMVGALDGYLIAVTEQ